MAGAFQDWRAKPLPYASVRAADDDSSSDPTGTSQFEAPSSGVKKPKLSLSYIKSIGRDSWTLETVSVVCSTVAFVIIVSILARYDGKSITVLPHGFTLNGFVSILALVAKAPLLTSIAAGIGQCKWLPYADSGANVLQDLQVYDTASRGPLGSIVLLMNAGKRPLAILGAILTIVAIGFDPSLQLLIHTDMRVLYTNDPGANLQHVMSFSDTGYYTDGLSLAYRDAIIRALPDSAASFDLPPTCPSKKCTWTTYQNLRLFSECIDLLPWMHENGGGNSSTFCKIVCPYVDDANGEPETSCGPMEQTITTCTYKMPQPFKAFITENDALANTEIQQGLLFSSGLPGSGIFNTQAAKLLPASVGQYPLAVTATIMRHKDFYYNASLCALGFRLDTFNTSVLDGVTSTHLLDSMILSNITNIDSDTIDAADRPNPGAGSATLHFTQDTPQASNLTSPQEQTILIENLILGLLNSSLPSYFVGNYSGDISASHEQLFPDPGPTREVLVGMYSTSNFSAMMDRIAASFSRQMLDTASFALSGQSGYMETYFVIAWAWLVLPVLVLFGGIAFLIITMIETKRRNVQIWKNSALPLVFNASGCDLKKGADPVKLGQMEKLAEETRVVLDSGRSTGMGFRVLEKESATRGLL